LFVEADEIGGIFVARSANCGSFRLFVEAVEDGDIIYAAVFDGSTSIHSFPTACAVGYEYSADFIGFTYINTT